MLRIQGIEDMSRMDIAARIAADDLWLSALAESLAGLGSTLQGYKPPSCKPLPRDARFIVEPVGKRMRLFKARRAGAERACSVRVVDADTMVRFGA